MASAGLFGPVPRGWEGGLGRGSWAGSGANGPGQQAEVGADRAGGVRQAGGEG